VGHLLSQGGAQSVAMAHIAPVRITTLADLSRHGYGLSCYCPRCRRWAELDLPRLAGSDLAQRSVTEFRPRCRRCGTPGEKQLRPPKRWEGPRSRATYAHYAARADA
jgi:hypothetical protein